MKKLLFLFLLCLSFNLTETAAAGTIAFLNGQTVVVDPGHGGYDPGAVRKGVYEKHINLQIALKIKQCLEETGARVILTRNGDYNLAIAGLHKKEAHRYDLAKRLEIANKSKASVFVSIHINCINKRSRSGAEVFYYVKSEKGRLLAECILGELRSVHGTPPGRTAKTSRYYVLRNAEVPAALVEVGFISNPDERKNLVDNEYQTLLAERISCGIIKYLALETY